jgi:hypothetical protein
MHREMLQSTQTAISSSLKEGAVIIEFAISRLQESLQRLLDPQMRTLMATVQPHLL